MHPPLPILSDYDVSPTNGFLPTLPPCSRLSDAYYAPWESLVASLQPLILTSRLRSVVDRLPLLTTAHLVDEPEWRRAYSILGFVVHAYVWGGETPADVIPPPLAIPFLETCAHLDLPPVATYAGLVLWNWKPLFSDEPIDSLENLATLHTLTGSLDESWFFLVSAAIEARGAPLLPLMLNAIRAARAGDIPAVTQALRLFAERIDDLSQMLARMVEHCDPHIFYHRIRPMLAGSKNMAEAGLPHGLLFDTGSPTDTYVQYSGGSNAQSSIIQFFDIVLGVQHAPSQPGAPNFIRDMRAYMPGRHAAFLEYMESITNIRAVVLAHADNAPLRTAYDASLAMLRAFRDSHIQLVSRYIIVPSRAPSTSPNRAGPSKRLNLAHPSASPGRKLRGTGGTALIPFLKQARDETGEPAIEDWARRLLSNGPGRVDMHSQMKRDPWLGGGGWVGLAGAWRVDDSEGGICHW